MQSELLDKVLLLRPYSAQQFIDWRNRLGLKQTDAAILLGITLRSVTYYETGGRAISWPTTVACFCYEHFPELKTSIPELLERGYSAGRV